jgi:hypothetical protein
LERREALSLANSSESQRKIRLAAGVSFSRREFRNREADFKHRHGVGHSRASVGANSGIVRRFVLGLLGLASAMLQSARIQES